MTWLDAKIKIFQLIVDKNPHDFEMGFLAGLQAVKRSQDFPELASKEAEEMATYFANGENSISFLSQIRE